MNETRHLNPSDLDDLERYVRAQGFLGDGERLLAAGKAGEGNMNLTLRLTTDRRSFIVKQSRPWVEKYPHIPAPADRALVEIAFYDATREIPELRVLEAGHQAACHLAE